MRVTIVPGESPGLLRLDAENSAEIMFIKSFASLSLKRCPRRLRVLNFGGNEYEGRMSMLIGYERKAKKP